MNMVENMGKAVLNIFNIPIPRSDSTPYFGKVTCATVFVFVKLQEIFNKVIFSLNSINNSDID